MEPRRTRALRVALAANALLSTTTGLYLLLDAPGIATWLGDVPAVVLQGIGASLLGFVALIASVVARPHPALALVVTVLDLGWVVGTAGLLLFAPHLFTDPGLVAFVAIGVLVGGAAVAQIVGVQRMLREEEPGRGDWHLCVSVPVPVEPDAMWAVVSDLGAIQRYSSSLAYSALRDGETPGVGALRTCRNTEGQQWSEACERFDPARRELDVQFLTDAPGLPFPVRTMVGGWRVRPSGDGSIVEVWWSLTPTTPLQWLAVVAMGWSVQRDVASMIGRMAEAARGRPVPDVAPRLASALC